MKTYFLYFFLPCLLVLSSCTKNEKEIKEEIKEIGKTFLTDFYYSSFEYAIVNADESTKLFIDYIEKNDKLDYRDQHLDKIDSVVLLTKDTALVYYQYENSFYKKDKHILPLIEQNGNWLVHIENRNNIDFYRYVFDYSLIEVDRDNYKTLNNEELIEIELFMNTFINQVNHPKLVVGILGGNSLSYYDIEDLENYSDAHSESSSYSYSWKDLSSFNLDVYLEFDNNEVLSEFEYFISTIESHNDLGVFEKMETTLIKEFGEPYNSQYKDKESWYKSLRWFVKGKNQMIELLNKEDGTLSLLLKESEPVEEYNY